MVRNLVKFKIIILLICCLIYLINGESNKIKPTQQTSDLKSQDTLIHISKHQNLLNNYILANTEKHRKDIEPQTYCELVGGTFAKCVQICLFTLVFAILVLKYYYYSRIKKTNNRNCKEWGLDVSKQGVSSVAAHCCGMITSLAIAHATKIEAQCGWYMITFFIDTSLGTFVAYLLLKGQEKLAKKYNIASLASSGVYYEGEAGHRTIKFDWYFFQIFVWTIIVMFGRMCVAAFLFLTQYFWKFIVNGLTSAFGVHYHAYLLFVMTVCPIFLNLIQAFIQDNFLKKKDVKVASDEIELVTKLEK